MSSRPITHGRTLDLCKAYAKGGYMSVWQILRHSKIVSCLELIIENKIISLRKIDLNHY